jgi:hypothetical protein
MKILTNGDSNMSGAELPSKSLSIGAQLTEMLGGEEINLAMTGASNDRIYDTTINYLKDNTVEFVVIGWTEMSRVQWFLVDRYHGGGWYEINNLGVGRDVPAEYNDRYHHWKKFMADNNEFHKTMSFYWHERIFNLHVWLNYKKIPHLFFNAFHPFSITDVTYQLDWNNSYFDPYNWKNTYVTWCADQGFKEITPGHYHYEPAGQRAWAELLNKYITEHQLI